LAFWRRILKQAIVTLAKVLRVFAFKEGVRSGKHTRHSKHRPAFLRLLLDFPEERYVGC
jgi:hypothetical protein